MTGKTGVLAIPAAAFFCRRVSAVASGVQGLVPTRDGDQLTSNKTTRDPHSRPQRPPFRPGPISGRAVSGDSRTAHGHVAVLRPRLLAAASGRH
jgi:hypothetical protein